MTAPPSKPPSKTPLDLNNLFGLNKLPQVKLDASHLIKPKAARSAAGSNFLDLTGKRKILFVVGAGNTGKTLMLRWACQQPSSPWVMMTVDTVNRELIHYFDNVATPPPNVDSQTWIARALEVLMADSSNSAAIDFGAGDTSLASLVQEVPDLAQVLERAGLTPVLLVMLSPRVSDLITLLAITACGFQPKATALVCNLGRAESDAAFHTLRNQEIYQKTVAQGAAEIWMPRLYGAGSATIEHLHMGFQAACGEDGPLTLLDQSRLTNWLKQMDEAFAPIRSWLP